MARIHANAVSGVLSAALTAGATSMSSAGLALLPVVTAPDIALIVLDPDVAGNGPEAVWVTAHTASATTATITRAAEVTGGLKTTAQSHVSGTRWVHSMSVSDFTGLTPSSSGPGDSAAVGASGQWADADHKHARTDLYGVAGSMVASAPGDAVAEGTSLAVARIDHKHAREAWGLVGDVAAIGTAAAAGASGKVADAAHVHALGAGAVDLDTKLVDGVVSTAKLADSGVTTAKLAASLLTSAADGFFNYRTVVASAPTTVTAVGSPSAAPDTVTDILTMACTRAGQVFFIWGTTDVFYTGNTGGLSEAITSLSVDNATVLLTPYIIGKNSVAGITIRVTLGQMWIVSGLSVASHTFRLKSYKQDADDALIVNATHTALNVLRIG